MFNQILSTLVLCLCFGAFSCTGGNSSGFLPDGGGGAISDPFGGVGGNPGGGGPGGGGPGGGGPGGGGPGGNLNDVGPGNDPSEPMPIRPGGPPEPVPEPMTMLLFGSGLAGVAYRYRRRNEQDYDEDAAKAI